MTASLATGVASALPAAALAILQKPHLEVLVSVFLACVAVAMAAHGYLYGRRATKRAQQSAAQRVLGSPLGPTESGEESDLADTVFAILWNRADPRDPMSPLLLAQMLTERSPLITDERRPEEIVRAVERIRVLGELPPLERGREGFFLNSDDLNFKRNLSIDAKRQIAFAAATYVKPGMSVAFDGGSTTLEVAKVLISRIVARTLDQLNVTTSSIQICSEFLKVPECREAIRVGDLIVWSMAGPLHPSCWTIDPPSTEKCPGPVDLAIIGANGILRDGFYLPTREGLEVKKTLIEQAASTLVVADSTKVGKRLPERFCTWEGSARLITNRPKEAEARRLLQSLPRHRVIYSSDVAIYDPKR